MKKKETTSKILTGIMITLVVLMIVTVAIFAFLILREVNRKEQTSHVTQIEPLKDVQVTTTSYHLDEGSQIKTTEELAKLKSAVIKIQTDMATGSGVLINEEGHILTNWHVIEDASDPIIIYFDENDHAMYEEFQYAKVLAYDAELDLAVLKIDEIPKRLDIKYIPLGDRMSVGVGQGIITIGSPQGLMNTVTEGIISAIREGLSSTDIQFTAPVSVGSSGGALINKKGQLIGIITYKIKDGDALNFAISIGDIIDFLDQNIAKDYEAFKAKKQPVGEFTLNDLDQNENYKAFIFSDNEIKGLVEEEEVGLVELGEKYLSGPYKIAFKQENTDTIKVEPAPFFQAHNNYELAIPMQMWFYEGRNQVFNLKSQDNDEVDLAIICMQAVDDSWSIGILSIIDGLLDSWGIEEMDGWIEYSKSVNYIRRIDPYTVQMIWKTENGYFTNEYTLNYGYCLLQAYEEDTKINDINAYIENGAWTEVGKRK